MTILQCVQKNQSCSVSECLRKATLLFLSFTHLTQLFLNGKVSSTISRPTKARHFLFLLDMGGVIPGKLGASLHNSDTDRKDRNQFPMNKKKSKRTVISAFLPAGEEGDDGEGQVMGVCEDVLEEEVRLAAVLQGAVAESKSNVI